MSVQPAATKTVPLLVCVAQKELELEDPGGTQSSVGPGPEVV